MASRSIARPSKNDPGPGVTTVPFTEEALRGTGREIPVNGVRLPAHVLKGKGVGQGARQGRAGPRGTAGSSRWSRS